MHACVHMRAGGYVCVLHVMRVHACAHAVGGLVALMISFHLYIDRSAGSTEATCKWVQEESQKFDDTSLDGYRRHQGNGVSPDDDDDDDHHHYDHDNDDVVGGDYEMMMLLLEMLLLLMTVIMTVMMKIDEDGDL
jgi:hypothetical protein